MRESNGQHTPVRENDLTVVGGAILKCLYSIEKLLRRPEGGKDFDETYPISGQTTGAAIVPISIPRTLSRVEITMQASSSSAVCFMALLQGNLTIAQAAAQSNFTGAGTPGAQNSNAIAVIGSGSMTVRDYLDQSGFLTVYISTTATVGINVRIRSLDTQRDQSYDRD